MIHIVYLADGWLLVKHAGGWRELQDRYPGYTTSLGPWSAQDVIDFLTEDWGADDRRWGWTRAEIAAFAASAAQELPGR